MVSSGLGGGAAARSRQDTGTNLLQELEALSQALYKASQAQNVVTGAPAGPSPGKDYHHHIHQQHHHNQRQQQLQPLLSPGGSGGLLRRGFPADVSNQGPPFDGGLHRRASMPATARNDAFDHIPPSDSGSTQIHGRKAALQVRHSISARPSTSLYPEQEREDLWRQQQVGRHSVASVPRPLPPLSAHAEEEPLAAGAAPGAPPAQPRSERKLQPWHSQGFEKAMTEIANFPEWLDDNISFSRKLEAVPEKKKSIWNWKPFRTLSHIGHTRYNCLFTLHVHAIEGLPKAMNGLRLSVHWRHKDRSVQTTPSRAFQCSAEFEETLKLRCSVYSSKSAHHAVKFMPKEFTLCVIALDIDELMLGQHHLDLTRLLPEAPDHEHEDDDKSLSWTTSFKLSGKAKGGTLVVTFGYELLHKERSDKSGRFGAVMESPSPSMSSPSLRSFGGSYSTHGTPRQRPSDGTNFTSPALSEPSEYYDSKAMEHLNLDDARPSESRSNVNSGASGSRSSISGSGFGGEVRKGHAGGTRPKHHSNRDYHDRAEQNLVSPGYGESKFKGVDYLEQVPEPALAPLTPRQREEPPAELTKEVSNVDGDRGPLSSSSPHESSGVDLDDEEQHEFTVVDQGVEVGTLPEGIYHYRKHSRSDEKNENLERLGSSSGSGSKVATSGREFEFSLDGPAGSPLETDRVASLSPPPLAEFHSHNVEEVRGRGPTVGNPTETRQQEQEVGRQGIEEEGRFKDAVEEIIPWDPLGKFRVVQKKLEEKSRPLVDLVVRHKELEEKDVVEERRLFNGVVKVENLQPPRVLDDRHEEQATEGSKQKQDLWDPVERHQEGDYEQSGEDQKVEIPETVTWETPLSTPFPANNVEFVWENRQQQPEAGTQNSGGEEIEDVSSSMELAHSSQESGPLWETPLSTPLSSMHQERVWEKDLRLGEQEKSSQHPEESSSSKESAAAASSSECQRKSEALLGTPSSTPFPFLREKIAREEDLQPGDENKSLQQQSEEGMWSNGSSKESETAAASSSERPDKSENNWDTPSSTPFPSLLEKSAWEEDSQPPLMENGEGRDMNSAVMEDFDDEIDLIADDFLAMLEGNGEKGGGFVLGMSSDSESDSPRALLLKQFEKEALLEGGVGLRLGTPEIPVLNFDAAAEGLDSQREEYAPPSDQFDGLVEDWQSGENELASVMEAAESELQKATQTMRSKTRAKMLEDAETEALMQEWGLNEKAFENSPPKPAQGFLDIMSNQMEKAPTGPPMLAQGLGPVVQTKDGGMLRTMTPTLFPQSSTSGKLVMQVSKPVVVPSEMGSSGLDIFRRLASSGVESMALQAMVAMPLEDITGKSVLQVAYESGVALKGPSYGQNGDNTELSTRSPRVRCTGDRTLARGSKFNGRSDLGGFGATGPSEEFVSLEELAPMALQKVEALAIDGLKIQADFADGSAPYQVDALPWRRARVEQSSKFSAGGSVGSLDGVAAMHLLDASHISDNVAVKADGLMAKVISIDEWMRLDSGQVEENDAKDDTLTILAAHGAVREDIIVRGDKEDRRKYLEGAKASANFGRGGFMGNALTIAMLVQLRDPLRSNEPVGAPMMALVQAERVIVPPRPKVPRRTPSLLGNSVVWDDEEGDTRGLHTAEPEAVSAEPQFKIIAVHVSGLNSTEEQSKELSNTKAWGNQKQQQSGSRWLVANGMGKSSAATSSKLPALKNKSQPGKDTTAKAGESLWSISSRNSGSASKWKDKSAVSSSIRNPDVKFAKQKNRTR